MELPSSKTVIDYDYVMPFGKYKGNTVEELMRFDPSYLLWCVDNIEWFEVDTLLYDEITELANDPWHDEIYYEGWGEDD